MTELIVDTGQHYDSQLRDVFFGELGLDNPTYRLGIGSGSHGFQTGRMLEAIEKVIQETQPSVLLVYGDTNSTLAGALAAAKLHVPVAHVEAGLRSFNRRMPEEINRIMTDHLARLLFTPTKRANELLAREGIEFGVHYVGDVMLDVVRQFSTKATMTSDILNRLGLTAKQYALATIHRAENTDSDFHLRNIVEGLSAAARQITFVLPIHPRTLAALERIGLSKKAHASLRIIPPVGYFDMLQLQQMATLIVTDSGGVQKEAYFHEVACVSLREETEWVELVEMGWNRLVPPASSEDVYAGVIDALSNVAICRRDLNPYGDGHAADHITEVLEAFVAAV